MPQRVIVCLTTVTVVLGGVGGLAVLPMVSGQTDQSNDRSARLIQLLEQRRDILRQAAELRVAEYRDGTCSMEEVLSARGELLEAELDAARTSTDRLSALEKHLKLARTGVAVAEQRFRSGVVTQIAVLRARAALLGVEIKLMRERGVNNPG